MANTVEPLEWLDAVLVSFSEGDDGRAVWARDLAREKGYVMLDATALLTAAMRNVILAPGSSRFERGRRYRLNDS